MAFGPTLLLHGRPLPLPSAPPVPPDCAWPPPPARSAPASVPQAQSWPSVPQAQPKRRSSVASAASMAQATEQTRKLVFLDVDGVLHAAHGAKRSFEPRCMEALARIVRETGASIVLSSSWRAWPDGSGVNAVNKAFKRHAIPPLISITPQSEGSRPGEMLSWLADNPVKRHTRWIAIDDMDLEAELGFRLVRTDAVAGLTQDDATYAIAVLEWDGISAQPVRPSQSDDSLSDEEGDDDDDDDSDSDDGVGSQCSRQSRLSGQSRRGSDSGSLLSSQSWRGSLADSVASSCPDHYRTRQRFPK